MLCIAALLFVLPARPAHAQLIRLDARLTATPAPGDADTADLFAPGGAPGGASRWWAPIASLGVPGSGQFALRQRRGIAYVLLEGALWFGWAHERAQGNAHTRSYRGIARDVARAPFSDVAPDGNFAYYESMEHFAESGVFDVDPDPTLQPETDPSTFNGHVWLLARQTFWADPDVPPPRDSEAFKRAEEFYLARAVRPEFRWSWVGHDDALQRFRGEISESNHAFHAASTFLGGVIANHLLSAADAFVTIRVSVPPDGRGDYRVAATLPLSLLGAPPHTASRTHAQRTSRCVALAADDRAISSDRCP
ncbi:MAG TPA: hypothetical protein VFK13_06795 [Gemmatimonadaceae bacterium]|nr:hypothetical protein [Gemmatimonadaceae bacterium]